jgi:4-hydroxy-tetrahydrodipicolinate synthase
MIKLQGIIAAMITPMGEDESINENGLRILVNRLIDAGIHGLFCLGTTGEFYALTNEEKERVVAIVVEEAKGRVPVYAGTGGISTREVISLIKRIQGLGVEAVSIITPFFVSPSQEELYLHYEMIARSVSMPIILYNIPMRTGVHLEPQTVARLSKVQNIIGIKDSSGKFENIASYIEMSDKDFHVLAGTDSLILDSLKAGGTGAIAATANVVPELVVSIYENFKNGKIHEAEAAQLKLKPLRDSFKLGTAPGVLKEAANIVGIPAGPSRMPVTRLKGCELEELEQVIRQNYM